jgi:LacI family transcriptional regulator
VKPKKKILLKDIAQEVGVSTALVSYVLNNQKENRISKEVADKIRKVAKELNYQPNQIAKSLKMQKTHTIGLIVADIANPFSSQLARIIEDEAKKKGYTVIFGSSDENIEKLQGLINVLLNRQVDGFIIAAVDGSDAEIEQLDTNGVPFVLIDRYFPDKPFPYVAIDNYGAAFTAVSHLANRGKKKIGLITYETTLFHLLERKRGYQAALRHENLEYDIQLVHEVTIDYTQQDVKQGIRRLLLARSPVDALLFGSNTLAMYGLKAIRDLNISIPEQVAVVTFDETDTYNLFYVSLTYIKQPLVEIGKQATEALLKCLQDQEHQPITLQVNLNAELIVQKSSM